MEELSFLKYQIPASFSLQVTTNESIYQTMIGIFILHFSVEVEIFILFPHILVSWHIAENNSVK